ncbi:hypothetical protein MA16_Dca028809 [Dendrobium catenatum]|uniref:Uncharacterized protein n=1 Tax=Dendrobium catenatum TaxID=906689 RepID=A0A2I0V8B0_9ASPA|nr:hypothetical protein MA16_Dca028809 [Dendrobium catenatum]
MALVLIVLNNHIAHTVGRFILIELRWVADIPQKANFHVLHTLQHLPMFYMH